MTSASSIPAALADLARALVRWLANWWRIVHLGVQLLAMALSPSTYTAAYRHRLLRHIYLGTAPSLLWFTVLTTLLSVVVIRIVLVTSVTYGLTQYALEMQVRVLVLELIPLTAALFASLRCTIPLAGEVAALRTQGQWAALQRAGADPMRNEALPRVSAGVFCALLLAAVSCAVTLLLAYLAVYGFTLAGFDAYTRTVGHVFNAGVSLVFGLKIVALALTVALLPLASVLIEPARLLAGGSAATSAELQGLVRMFFLILLIEALSLVGNYY
jgi:phospholipid/cholesterol/gamma-HCH transport system permease protein